MTELSSLLPRVHWRLRDVMAERGVPSVAALRRRLKDYYPFISDVQLGRVVNHLPERMNMPLLIALCHALECTPVDLMHWGTCAPAAPCDKPASFRKAAPELSPEDIARLKGPAFKVFALPAGEHTP
ncbi:helix-turn-helix domain-containing protein [Lysobacter sp. 22409]|uniref:helix-turn-helix domain-containing protein n=1 Tax=Lysobacter sp. 22409 TaxID=3453917 RepID=UPI003F8545AF